MKKMITTGEIDTQEMLLQEAIAGRAKLVGTLHGVPIWSHVDAKKDEVIGLKAKIPFRIEEDLEQ